MEGLEWDVVGRQEVVVANREVNMVEVEVPVANKEANNKVDAANEIEMVRLNPHIYVGYPDANKKI